MAGTSNYPGALDTHSSGDPFGFAVQADNCQTSLSAAVSSGAATISVANTTSFPSRGSAWIDSDEFTYTGKNSTGFTGVSGLDSPHLQGAVVAQVPSARNHNDLAAAVVALETKLGISTSTSGAGAASPSTSAGDVLHVVSTNGETRYGPRAMIALAETVLASTSATVTFSNIPSNYRSLQLEAMVRHDGASITQTSLSMQINGDTGANYYDVSMILFGTTFLVQQDIAATRMQPGGCIGNSAPAGQFSINDLLFPNYASTAANKGVRNINSAIEGASPSTAKVIFSGGQWGSTAAITSISLFPGNGSTAFAAGSRFSLYGLPSSA